MRLHAPYHPSQTPEGLCSSMADTHRQVTAETRYGCSWGLALTCRQHSVSTSTERVPYLKAQVADALSRQHHATFISAAKHSAEHTSPPDSGCVWSI
jgi:hypothetical protein